jgi:hypothetical protein
MLLSYLRHFPTPISEGHIHRVLDVWHSVQARDARCSLGSAGVVIANYVFRLFLLKDEGLTWIVNSGSCSTLETRNVMNKAYSSYCLTIVVIEKAVEEC